LFAAKRFEFTPGRKPTRISGRRRRKYSTFQQLFVVVKGHGLGESLGNGEFQQFDDTIQQPGEGHELVPGEVAQHIIGRVVMQRPAYSDPHPDEPVAPQFLQQGAETVVTGVTAPLLQFNPAEGDIEVIVDDDKVLKENFMEIQRLGHGTPGEIHEGLGFQKKQSLPLKGSLAAKSGKIFPGDRNSGAVAKSV
jgi:hypothetical protein